MARNNIKILSPAQLEKLNAKYYFEVDGQDILVGLNGYQRVTRHSRDKCFHINSRNDVKRKICFSKEAIDIWLTCKENKLKLSLFDVQNAVNNLTVTYQPVSYENVVRFFNRSMKIQTNK